MEKNFKLKILEIIVIIGSIFGFGYMSIVWINDLRDAAKVENIQKELVDLRVALEIYYQKTGEYPELTRFGAKDNLETLDFKNEKGEVISFSKIYGKNSIPKTIENGDVKSSNEVYDLNDFNLSTDTGGWNYNFSGRTGEIHLNLPDDLFPQKINWKQQ
ncbi:MAG: hypothetical protein RR191_02060 [Cetobacterium sp.]|uniref:hypothetical protein n=1 Tax=unclassified Cetobacterium TaxID=2630983 RepID=UPI00163B6356|nr:hypothetical protein [Cetobacterium sp. 2A]MBC2855828.1 hypothetical protein [Cetobacterium sp. 2A]